MPVIGGWNKRNDPPGMRWCPRCKALVPHADFTKKRTGPSGFGAYCRSCKAALKRESCARLVNQPDELAAARFWPKVIKDAPGGCWHWNAQIGPDGYPRFAYKGQTRHAHRVAMILTGHDVPDGMHVDHCVCRDPACVNPAHMRVVAPGVNATENNDSPFAVNARKTHCKRGHELAGDNIRYVPTVGPKGTPMAARMCVACFKLRRPNGTVPPINTREDAIERARARKLLNPFSSEGGKP